MTTGQHPAAAAAAEAGQPRGEGRELDLAAVTSLSRAILEQVERAVVGKRHPLTLVLSAILAGGHVLLEDFPGLGKTLAARSFATTLGLEFTRAQFTPDLLPSDVTAACG